jgi:hypothetical protein
MDINSAPDDSGTPDAVAENAQVNRTGDAGEGAIQEAPYRKSHADLSCIRLIAASAIVAGLLLGTAPVALAQVGHLIVTAPAAFVQEKPAATLRVGSLDAELSSAQSDSVDRTVPYRSEVHAVTSMLSWKGTSRALRCSYGLLIDGNSQSCLAAWPEPSLLDPATGGDHCRLPGTAAGHAVTVEVYASRDAFNLAKASARIASPSASDRRSFT